ncbi:hypothetical protein EVB27_139 [Rhizobium phage RHph_TM16]|nr:hypothetical protein EVB27_139 [Rhizobium phage RHph_TM16]
MEAEVNHHDVEYWFNKISANAKADGITMSEEAIWSVARQEAAASKKAKGKLPKTRAKKTKEVLLEPPQEPAKPKRKGPPLGSADMYHLADVLGAAMEIDGHHLFCARPPTKTLDIRGFPISFRLGSIDGVVGTDYAAVDVHISGDLHLYLLVMASDIIRNFTILWISSGNPTEPLQSAFGDTGEPKPLPEFLSLLDGNTRQGFWTNDRKRWAELPEAAYLDLRERGDVDLDLRKLLQR